MGEVLRNFGRMNFLPVSQERMPDSVQDEVLRCLELSGCTDNVARWRKARAEARGLLFECAIGETFLYGRQARGTNDEAMILGTLLEDPYSLVSNDGLPDFIADKLSEFASSRKRSSVVSESQDSCAEPFLAVLHRELDNAARREVPKPTDIAGFVFGRHWTNSHCPLWLMQNGAILKACKALTEGGSWTEAAIKNLLKRTQLPRHEKRPIIDVVLNEDGNITGFVIARGLSRFLEPREYGWSFLPEPEAPPRPSYEAMMGRPGPWTLGEISAKEKELGIVGDWKPVRPKSYEVWPQNRVRHRVDGRSEESD